jgi:hypothetical protein
MWASSSAPTIRCLRARCLQQRPHRRAAAGGWRPYRDYIGSNLEVMKVDGPDLECIHTAAGSFQAPELDATARF